MGLSPSLIVSITSIIVSTLSLTVHILTAWSQRRKVIRQRRTIQQLEYSIQQCTCNEVHSEYIGQLQITDQSEDYTKGKVLVIRKTYLDTGKEVFKLVTEVPFTLS